jgi:L-iditol 2-dehydrogenase
MKAAVLKAPSLLELDDLPDPECPKGGTLIKVLACAVCGTDVKMLQQGHRDLAYPRILGHEIVGRIAEIDSDCGLKEGDICQIWPGIACGICGPCLREADNRCRNMKIMGFNCDGGFAEYMALPKQSLSRGMNSVPANTDPALASLAEPLACCINGQELAMVSKGDAVLIYGAGPIGALHALLAELNGARSIIIAEKLPLRIREIEKHTHARVIDQSIDHSIDQSDNLESMIQNETGGEGVDVILTATPEVKVDGKLLRLLAPGGRISIFSGPQPGNYEEQIDLRLMHYHELMIVGAYGCSSRQNRLALNLLTSGNIRADWVITKKTTLADIKDAFSHSFNRSGLKSVVCGV